MESSLISHKIIPTLKMSTRHVRQPCGCSWEERTSPEMSGYMDSGGETLYFNRYTCAACSLKEAQQELKMAEAKVERLKPYAARAGKMLTPYGRAEVAFEEASANLEAEKKKIEKQT